MKKLVRFDWAVKKLLRSKANFGDNKELKTRRYFAGHNLCIGLS